MKNTINRISSIDETGFAASSVAHFKGEVSCSNLLQTRTSIGILQFQMVFRHGITVIIHCLTKDHAAENIVILSIHVIFFAKNTQQNEECGHALLPIHQLK